MLPDALCTKKYSVDQIAIVSRVDMYTERQTCEGSTEETVWLMIKWLENY